MNEKNIIFENTELHYTTSGKGKAIVLIHGFGEDGTVWDEQILTLQHDYFLIIPDLPGSGKSDLLENMDAGMEDYAKCIYEILEAEKIRECTMIGHSMGGYITLAFAEMFPSRLKAFGLFHSSAFADDEEKINTRKKAIEFIRNNGGVAFLKTSVPGLFYETEKSKSFIDSLLKKGESFTNAALIQYYNAMIKRPDRTQVLKNFRGSILLIAGEHDKAVPFQHSLQQSHLPRQSNFYVLRNSAHMGMYEEKEKSNKSLTEFI